MARLTIELRTNKRTGRPELIVSLESDADQLPHEEEAAQRMLVEQLMSRGLDRLLGIESIRVERVGPRELQDSTSVDSPVVEPPEFLDQRESDGMSSSD